MKKLLYFILGLSVFVLMGTQFRSPQISQQDRSNLRILYVAASNYDIDVDYDGLSIEGIYDTSGNITIALDASGVNGLDTGSITAGDDYYSLFVIYNLSSGAEAGLASLSQTSPTMPAGYTIKRYIGTISVVDGEVRPFYMSSYGHFYWIDDWTRVLSGGTASSYTDVDCSGSIPPSGIALIGGFYCYDTSATTATAYFRRNTSVTGTAPAVRASMIVPSGTIQIVTTSVCPLDPSQILEYKQDADDAGAYIDAYGYIDHM